jgi:hypothetical protein
VPPYATDATERIIGLCREAATRHGLTGDEYAYLVCRNLIASRENRHHEDLSSKYTINLVA